MAEPDTAAEHADFMAGETSPLERQQGLQSGFALSRVQVRGSPVKHDGHFPKRFSGDLQV